MGEKISYKDGLKDGRWITYYDDGYVYMVRYNKDGKYFGYTYYDDEIPEDWDLPDDYEEEDIDLTYGNELMMVRFSNDGQYEYGRKHGEWVYYSIPTNEVKSRGVYKYGKFDGKWI